MKKRFVPLFALVFIAIFLCLFLGVRASFTQNSVGWVWGGLDAGDGNSVVGWVSVNSRDCDTDGNGTVDAAEGAARPGCPVGSIVDYGVNVPESNGALSGYAWSEKYGWISFNPGDVAGCPNVTSNGTCDAWRLGNNLVGWARILSIRDGGAGWSGWLKLGSDGTDSVSYGITLAGRNLSGYAYSDEIGWIDFASAQILPADFYQLCIDGAPFLSQGDAPKSYVMNDGASVSIQTYFDNTNDCLGTPVTAATAFVESAGNPNAAVITLSGVSPKVASGGIDTSPSGKQTGTETVATTYNGKTLTINFTVEEVCTISCADPTVCAGVPYDVIDSCQQTIVNGCTGARSCDYNYREIAP